MLFARVTTFFIAFASLASPTFSSPTANAAAELEKRQGLSSLTGIISTLESAVGGILPELSSLGLGGTTSTAGASSLITELVTVLDTATTALSVLNLLGGLKLEKRQSPAQDAAQLASMITNIANTLAPLQGNADAAPMLAQVDSSIHGLLVQENILVPGVVVLVSGLLVDVAVELHALAFTLTLALLGL